MIEKPLQWHFSMKHEDSLLICRSLFNANLKEKIGTTIAKQLQAETI